MNTFLHATVCKASDADATIFGRQASIFTQSSVQYFQAYG